MGWSDYIPDAADWASLRLRNIYPPLTALMQALEERRLSVATSGSAMTISRLHRKTSSGGNLWNNSTTGTIWRADYYIKQLMSGGYFVDKDDSSGNWNDVVWASAFPRWTQAALETELGETYPDYTGDCAGWMYWVKRALDKMVWHDSGVLGVSLQYYTKDSGSHLLWTDAVAAFNADSWGGATSSSVRFRQDSYMDASTSKYRIVGRGTDLDITAYNRGGIYYETDIYLLSNASTYTWDDPHFNTTATGRAALIHSDTTPRNDTGFTVPFVQADFNTALVGTPAIGEYRGYSHGDSYQMIQRYDVTGGFEFVAGS